MTDAVLNDIQRAGPYRIAINRLEDIRSLAGKLGLPVVETPADQKTGTATEWMARLGQALAFPAHFGCNFDALYDCLCDKDILAQPALIILIQDISPLADEETDTLIAVLQAAADEWRDHNRKLWALFATPGIELEPLPEK